MRGAASYSNLSGVLSFNRAHGIADCDRSTRMILAF